MSRTPFSPITGFPTTRMGTLIVYPMLTENRRAERQPEAVASLLEHLGAKPAEIIDLTAQELKGNFLEGTGSLVLDRVHKVAFAMQSPRTTTAALELWSKTMGYEPFLFHAYDKHSRPLYHTNVFMNIGEGFAVACPESIASDEERQSFIRKLGSLGKELIAISLDQAYGFCGNVLQLKSKDGSAKIVLSETALHALSTHQREQLRKHGQLVTIAIPTIEAVGGGGVRCMMAEIFPPSPR